MRLRTILVVALVLSAALNAALLGYAYTLYRVRPLAFLSDPIPPQMVEALTSRLPGQAGGILRDKLEAGRPTLETERSSYRAPVQKAAGLIAADTIDMTALRAAIAEARDHRGRMGDVYVGALVETLAALPAADRRALIERFRRR